MPIASHTSFGIEIELTGPGGVPPRGPGWDATVGRIAARLEAAVTAPVVRGATGPGVWAVKDDRNCGYEVTSPVRLGADGFAELARACAALTALVDERPGELSLGHRCGLHLTLAAGRRTADDVKGLLRLVQRLEPGLFTPVAPSRPYRYRGRLLGYARRAGNPYGLPVRGLGDVGCPDLMAHRADPDSRYRAVTATRTIEAGPLVEVRMHSGTKEFRKIARRASLWMQILNRARFVATAVGATGPVVPLRDRPIGPRRAAREDIIRMLAAEGALVPPEFAELVRTRRRELLPQWTKVLPVRAASWIRAGW